MLKMSKIKMGFAICGSFCTFSKVIKILADLPDKYEVTPILSGVSATMDTRFYKAEDFVADVERLCGRPAIKTIAEAEPIGPKGLFDVLVVAPCTGNTLAKLAVGVTDTSVTMACKAHLRNARPLVIAVSTNDGLSTNAKNIATLINKKNVYFVPFGQDDAAGKPASLVADFVSIDPAVQAALTGTQLQPVILP